MSIFNNSGTISGTFIKIQKKATLETLLNQCF